MYHKLLSRQLRRLEKASDNGEVNLEALLEVVSESYEHADHERRKIENSLSLMSQEMLALNEQIQNDADAAIQAANKRFELAVSGTMDGIWDWNLSSGELYFSPIWYKLLGYEDQALPYHKETWFSHIHPDDRKLVEYKLDAFAAGDLSSNQAQYRIRKKNGAEIWVESKWTGATCAQNKICRIVGTIIDISVQKQTELLLKKAKENAEKTAQLKSDFLASMSHEIRTPMNGVIGVLSLLEDTELTDYQSSLCETIRNSGMLLLSIINDILDFSKIEAGKLHTETIPCQLGDICQTVQRGLQAQASDKGIHIAFEVSEAAKRTVHTDPTRVQQILFNLWGNGIKFTKAGSVTVHVDIDPRDASLIQVKIVDTGIGIPKDKIPKLFQMFNQVDNSISRNFGGTGLGLSISKRLVELLGGTIHIESTHGKGSTFTFTLKDAPEKKQQGTTKTVGQSCKLNAPDYDGAPLNILVAEDNKVNQFLIQKLLENAGHTVTIANNGQEAIDSLQKHQNYNMILMDIHMPEVDGIAATKAIRSLGHPLAQIPIIALTANVMDSDRHNYLEIGMNDYLSKPIDKEVLFRTLHTWGGNFPLK